MELLIKLLKSLKHAQGNLQLSVIKHQFFASVKIQKIGHFRIGLELTTKTARSSELENRTLLPSVYQQGTRIHQFPRSNWFSRSNKLLPVLFSPYFSPFWCIALLYVQDQSRLTCTLLNLIGKIRLSLTFLAM